MRCVVNFLSGLALTIFVASANTAAFADTIVLTANRNVEVDVSSPDSNFWGEYSTANPGVVGNPDFVEYPELISVPGVSLILPSGSVITSATAAVIFPSPATELFGTGSVVAGPQFGQRPGTGPSSPPSFGEGPSEANVEDQGTFPKATIYGDDVSTGDLDLLFEMSGNIRASLNDPGTNWSGYLIGSGEIDLPYTVQLDVTYTPTPVPEPSTLAMLGTGILGAIGAARRKLFT